MLEGFTRREIAHQRRHHRHPPRWQGSAAAAAARQPVHPPLLAFGGAGAGAEIHRGLHRFARLWRFLEAAGRREPHQLFLPRHGAGPGRGDGDAGLPALRRGRPRPRRAGGAPHVPRPSRSGSSAPLSSTSCRSTICSKHQSGIRRLLLSLVLHGAARRLPRAADGRRPGVFHPAQAGQDTGGLELLQAGGAGRVHPLHQEPRTIHAMCEDYRATVGSISTWTPPMSRPAARSTARSCCCGAPPAGWVNITSRWRYGRVMPAIFGAAWRSPVAIISAKSVRQRRRPSCYPSSPSGRADPDANDLRLSHFCAK